MKQKRYKRRNYFIKKEFQGRTIFNYFILVIAGSILFAAIFSFFSSNTLSIVYENYQLQLGTTPFILMKRIFSTQWFFIIVGGAAVILITLFLTHRVAGPFFRFEKTLDEMIDGNISLVIYLRKKDEGKDLAAKVNRFNAMLSETLADIEKMNNQINFQAKRMESDARPADALEKIKTSSKQINEVINHFQFVRE